jgi:hypothetical protein
VKATVEDHHVRLVGSVPWNYQREAAAKIVSALQGVVAVLNDITVAPKVTLSESQAEQQIRAALVRNAQVDSRTIRVHASGTTIELTGTVRSWTEYRQASHAAWASPGVTHVRKQDPRHLVTPARRHRAARPPKGHVMTTQVGPDMTDELPVNTEDTPLDVCWELLAQHQVARLAVVHHGQPDIFLISYVVERGGIVFRTGAGTKLAAARSHSVALEVDGEDRHQRWRVLVVHLVRAATNGLRPCAMDRIA